MLCVCVCMCERCVCMCLCMLECVFVCVSVFVYVCVSVHLSICLLGWDQTKAPALIQSPSQIPWPPTHAPGWTTWLCYYLSPTLKFYI